MNDLAMELEATVLAVARPPWRGVIDLQWRSCDPCVVRVVFPDGLPAWAVSRDLLADGLEGAAGLHDVSVILDPDDRTVVEVVLSTPNGRCAVRMDRIDLDAFLRSTLHRVPFGAEVIAPAALTTADLAEWDGGPW